MRINAIALMRAAGVRCLYEEGGAGPFPARIALVTEESVRAARALAERDSSLRATETSPQLRYGGALAYVGSGTARRHVLLPGEGNAFMLQGRFRFLGNHMLDAERVLSGSPELPAESYLLLSSLRSVLRLVATVPDEDRFPQHLIVQACRFSLRDAFGDARLPVGEVALSQRSRAELIRGRIAAIDPKNPDALGACAPFARLLDRAGADVRIDGLRVSGIGVLNRNGIRPLVEGGAWRDGLFSRVTRTPPENIDAVALPTEEAARVELHFKDARLTGPWVDGVRTIGDMLTGSGTNGYRLDLTFYAVEGRDLMMMSDTVGQETGVSILFSWPSCDRAPTIETSEGPVYAICPEEVPSQDEVIRLEKGLAELVTRQALSMTPQDALET
jgi:hypothetical protein